MPAEWAFSRHFTFLPAALKLHGGYATHALGKWHLGGFAPDYTPCARGFDTFLGFLSGEEDYWYHNQAAGALDCTGFDFTQANTSHSRAALEFTGNYSAGVFGDAAAAIIRSTPLSTPLFIYLAMQSVHYPIQAPPALVARYTAERRPRPAFTAMVRALDDAFGTVLDALGETGRAPRAVHIVTTDNGGCFCAYGNNHPLRGNKMTFWDGGSRAVAFISSPLLRRAPAAGMICNYTHLMHSADLFATTLQIAGLNLSTALPETAVDSVGHWGALRDWPAAPAAAPSAPAGETVPRLTLVHHVAGAGQGKVRQGRWQLYTMDPTPDAAFWHTCNPGPDAWRGTPTADNPYGVTEVVPGRVPPPQPSASASCRNAAAPGSTEVVVQCSVAKPCLYDIASDAVERHDVAATNPATVAALSRILQQASCQWCHVDEPSHCPLSACAELARNKTLGPHCNNPPPPPPFAPSRLRGAWSMNEANDLVVITTAPANSTGGFDIALNASGCPSCCWRAAVGTAAPSSEGGGAGILRVVAKGASCTSDRICTGRLQDGFTDKQFLDWDCECGSPPMPHCGSFGPASWTKQTRR